MRHLHHPHDRTRAESVRNATLPRLLACAGLALGLGATGCNLFASFGVKARGTVNTLGKRNVDFDRPAPAQKDLAHIHTVAVGELKGKAGDSARITGYLSSYLSESERFALVSKEAEEAAATTAAAQTPAAATVDGAVDDGEGEAEEAAAPPPQPTGRATIEGTIVAANYDERMDSQRSKCGENKTCTTKTRIGTATVTVDLRLIDDATGEVLLQKQVGDRKEITQSATDSTPPSIDGQALLDSVSQTAAGQFFAAVSPHIVQETVFFETDGKAKALKEGANRAMGGDLEGAIEAFEQGLSQANAKRDEKAVAKARFDLGLALVIDGDYERGLDLLKKAQRPKSRKAWTKVVLDAKQWKTDAERAKQQWSARSEELPPLDPDIRPSADATKDGFQAVRALRAVAGR